MTNDEAKTVLGIMGGVEDSYYARALFKEFLEKFPQFQEMAMAVWQEVFEGISYNYNPDDK